MERLYFILFVISFLSCKNFKDNRAKGDSIQSVNRSSIVNSDTSINADKFIDYFALGESVKETTFGTLQGVADTDSAGPYVRKVFSSDSLNFDLIYFPKRVQKKDVNFENFNKNVKLNGVGDFYCFVFAYQPKNSGAKKNYHDDNTTYPINLKAYIYKDGVWKFLSTKRINNLSEFSQYQIDIMYSNI